MIRHSTILLIALVCFAAFACQKQAERLEQTVARADDMVIISTLRNLSSAQNAYNLSTGSYGTFTELVESGYLDARFNSDKPVVREYVLMMTVTQKTSDTPNGAYSCNANPQRAGAGSGRYFYIDSNSSIIRVNATQPASATDEILQP
ncbi:MAG: hypothetical protein ACRD8U_04665 [Pyrinomonadaceae bacterium]